MTIVSCVDDSCFLLAMQHDSIEGIYDTLKQCALISKNAGGVGLHVHCIRASGSFIAGVSLPCTVLCLSGGKRGDYQNCFVLQCIRQLCTVISTLR